MNCSIRSSLLFLSFFTLSTSLHAQDSFFSWLFSSLSKDGTISLIKPTLVEIDGQKERGYGVDYKGFITFVVLSFVAVKISAKVTEKTVDMLMPILMNYHPSKQSREDYQREQEEKVLDKELEIAAFEEKRNKVAQWKKQQEAGCACPDDGNNR